MVLHPQVTGPTDAARYLREIIHVCEASATTWIATGEQIARHYAASNTATVTVYLLVQFMLQAGLRLQQMKQTTAEAERRARSILSIAMRAPSIQASRRRDSSSCPTTR